MSRKKRVSWFFESQPEPSNEEKQPEVQQQLSTNIPTNNEKKLPSQNIAIVSQNPSTQPPNPQPQIEIESNRTRKISFIPFISNRAIEQTPPKLSTISEEQPSSKKIEKQPQVIPIQSISMPLQPIQQSVQKQMQHSLIQTPSQQQFRTPKAPQMEENSAKQSHKKTIKPVEIDIVKDIQQLTTMIEANEQIIKKMNSKEEVELFQIQEVLAIKINKLQQRLIQINEIKQKQIEQKYIQGSNRKNEEKDEPQGEQKIDKGSSQQIRAGLVQCLGYRVTHIFYEKKQYQLIFQYEQANVTYQFQNQKQIDSNLDIQDIFNEFYRELQENRLVLTGLKVEYQGRTQIQKAEILQLSLKQQFSNSNKMSNEIIFSAIHQMPILLNKIDDLEVQLTQTSNIWGALWKLDQEKCVIQILIGHRHKIDEKNLKTNTKKKLLRFELSLKNFELQYQFCKLFDEIVFPFYFKDSKKKRSTSEISFGEQALGMISDEYTEAINDFLSRKPTIIELIDWLNILQLN